jgi:hypothetical protein
MLGAMLKILLWCSSAAEVAWLVLAATAYSLLISALARGESGLCTSSYSGHWLSCAALAVRVFTSKDVGAVGPVLVTTVSRTTPMYP